MAEVSIRIGERDYTLACDDGQEKRLKVLAEEFGQRIAFAHDKHDSLGETQAMLVAALTLLDEFDEAKARWEQITPEGAAAEWAAAKLDQASERIEKALASAT